MKKQIFIGLFVYWIIGLFPQLAHGEVMTNDKYSIEKRSIQIQPFITEQPKPKEQTTKHYAQGENFTVDTTNSDPFSFSVAQETIHFGTPQATNPIIRKLNLSLNSSRGYQILVAADHPLSIFPSNEIIPDTTCDNGSCTDTTQALWINTLTYGFGYHTEEMDSATFRQFANSAQNERPQPLFAGEYAKNKMQNVTYKVNISNTQSKGAYTNSIFYIATPDF